MLRPPDAVPMPVVDRNEHAVDVWAVLDRKVDAVTCYATQVGFQFGSAAQAGPALRALADAEGHHDGADGPAEELRASAAARAVLADAVATSRVGGPR